MDVISSHGVIVANPETGEAGLELVVPAARINHKLTEKWKTELTL